MGLLGLLDDNKVDTGFSVAQNPTSSFGDVFEASLEATARNYLTVSKPFFTQNELDGNASKFKDLTGKDLKEEAFNASPDSEALWRANANAELVGTGEGADKVHAAVDAYITNLKTQDPEKYKDIQTSTEIQETVKQKARDSLVKQSQVEAGARGLKGSIANMAGGFTAGLIDPVNLSMMSLGAAPAESFLKAALKDAAINAGTEAINQPVVAHWQNEIGNEYGFKEGAENVGMAALFGGAFGAAIHGISLGFAKSKSLMMGKVADALEERGDIEGMRAAQYEERRQYIQESNPAKLADGLDPKAHAGALSEVDAALNEGRPLDPDKLGVSDDEIRSMDPERMDSGLADAYERIVEPDTAEPAQQKTGVHGNWDYDRKGPRLRTDLEHGRGVRSEPVDLTPEPGLSPANQPNPLLDFRNPEAPTLQRQMEIEKFYDSPEWKQKEQSNFTERFQGSPEQRIFLEEGGKDLSVDTIRKAFDDDEAFLKAIRTCGLGG